jgi:5-methylthioadenosine/S-adenosylhomocysteine deaminase
VGPDATVPRPPGATSAAYPGCAVLPGLVNLHTHLELQEFRGAVAESDFPSWIRHMRRIRETAGGDAYVRGARAGLEESWRYGTTTVADTGISGATVRALAELGGRGVYFQEVLGPDTRTADQRFRALVAEVEELRRMAPAWCAVGISPHAPYTVSPALLELVVAYARERGLALASHIAESAAETAFVVRGEGPFAESWTGRGFPLPAPAPSAVQYAERMGLLGRDLLAIHVVEADEDDIALLARTGSAVALCPRSNRRHGHGDPPLRQLRAAGVRLGLGTDSAASVDSLDPLAEARAARELGGLSAERALRLVTTDAAEAIGMARDIGALEPGTWADFCVLDLEPGGAGTLQALPERLLAAPSCPVVATWVAGRQLHGRSPGSPG